MLKNLEMAPTILGHPLMAISKGETAIPPTTIMPTLEVADHPVVEDPVAEILVEVALDLRFKRLIPYSIVQDVQMLVLKGGLSCYVPITTK